MLDGAAAIAHRLGRAATAAKENMDAGCMHAAMPCHLHCSHSHSHCPTYLQVGLSAHGTGCQALGKFGSLSRLGRA